MRVTAPASPVSNSTPPRIRRRAPNARDVILLACDVDDHRDPNGTPFGEELLARERFVPGVSRYRPLNRAGMWAMAVLRRRDRHVVWQ
jgi:hypothetical protein